MSASKKNIRAFLSILLLLPITSCSSKKQKKLSGEPSNSSPFDRDERSLLRAQLIQKDASRGEFFTVEGKLFDVPLPLAVYPCDVLQNVSAPQGTPASDEESLFFYESSDSLSNLYTFFREQMEVFGWHYEFSICSQECIVLFKKNTKRCIISLRTNIHKTKHSSLIVIGIC